MTEYKYIETRTQAQIEADEEYLIEQATARCIRQQETIRLARLDAYERSLRTEA